MRIGLLGLGHRSGCTKNINTVSLVDFFSTPFGVDTLISVRLWNFKDGGS